MIARPAINAEKPPRRWVGSVHRNELDWQLAIGDEVYTYILFSGLISLVLWAAVCFVFFARYRMPVYHPMSVYLIYHFFGFIVRPFAIYGSHWSFIWSRIGFAPAPSDIVVITVVSNLALLCCAAGLLFGMRHEPQIYRIPPTKFSVTRPFGMALAIMVLVAAGLYSTFVTYGTAGLDSVATYNVIVDDAGGQRLQDTSGYTLALAEALPVVCILLLFSRVPPWIAWITTALFVVLRIYVGAQRLSFVVVIAAALMGILIAKRRRFPTIVVILSLVFGAVVFDFVGHDRYVLRRVVLGDAGVGELVKAYTDERSGDDSKAMDVVEYETGSAAIAIVRDYSGYSYGSQYLRALIWPIPRQVWHDKPVFTSTINLNAYGHNFYNLTHTLYADLYMTFGFPAVAIGMLFMGWGMARVYELGRTATRPMGYMFFWIFLIYLQTMLRDGEVSFIFFWGFSAVFAWVVIEAGGLKIIRGPYFEQPRITYATPRQRRQMLARSTVGAR